MLEGKKNYLHVVEIKWVFSGKLVCVFVFVLGVFFLFTIGWFCFIFSVCRGEKMVFFFIVITFT